MSHRFTKKLPEFIYFVEHASNFAGPYVHPQKGHTNRKFKLTEVLGSDRLIAVICLNLNDFDAWQKEVSLVEDGFRLKDRFKVGDTTYLAVRDELILCSKRIDGFTETNYAKENLGYEKIKMLCNYALTLNKKKK